MYFRLTSLPELRHLTLSERHGLIRASAGSSIICRILAKSLGFGVGLGIVGMILIHTLWLRDRFPEWITLLLASTAFTFLVYCLYLIRVRGGVLLYLEEYRKANRLPMCLNCGYNLKGVASETCPECGTRIAPSAP